MTWRCPRLRFPRIPRSLDQRSWCGSETIGITSIFSWPADWLALILYSYFNSICVRSFILNGAPASQGQYPCCDAANTRPRQPPHAHPESTAR